MPSSEPSINLHMDNSDFLCLTQSKDDPWVAIEGRRMGVCHCLWGDVWGYYIILYWVLDNSH